MTRDERDPERDDELPACSSGGAPPWCRRAWTSACSPRIAARRGAASPGGRASSRRASACALPVAVGVLMLLIVTAAIALRPAGRRPPRPGPAEPVRAARRGDVPVVSRTSLAGFQPVTEVTATVVTDQAETRQ